MTRQQSVYLLFVFTLLLLSPALASAGEVRAGLSSQDAYVGAPITLRIDILNANDYTPPEIPEIDGLKIQSAGAPRISSQVTIINGRRSSSESASLLYQIIPMRAGSFEIPPLVISLDGRKELTPKFTFRATKSETGDLLFVEVDKKADQVYVGEPLELTLKIWIKPYRNEEHRIELDESEMWGLVSENSSWGIFADRMQELAENRQRPGGRDQLREDGEGKQQRYFLYSIDATIYPNRPGQIEAGDVNIIVDYPTSLGGRGRRRGARFESPFGNSPLSQLFEDDFFASPFDNSLSITGTRPIVAGAEVKSTEVIPVPSEGRPEDYRGTIGKYDIFTQIDNANVRAGDPIQLDIGITGNGKMDLVQAPPLTDMKMLTDNFKISDQPLAGLVQGNTKLFSTTIRPLHDGVTEIPPIPLSFFNPATNAYETVTSEPIPITVAKSDTLSLDSIVSAPSVSEQRPASQAALQSKPNFINDHSEAVLVNQSPPRFNQWWLSIVIAPPVLWLIVALVVHAKRLTKWIPDFRSPGRRCAIAIESAKSGDELIQSLANFVGGEGDPERAVGTLRLEGLYTQAAELESFIDRVRQDSIREVWNETMSELRTKATELMQRIASARSLRSKSLIQSQSRRAGLSEVGRNLTMILLCGMLSCRSTAAADTLIQLEPAQKQSLLDEASRDYTAAIDTQPSHPEDANELFRAAASKYQKLVDSGIQNSRLFTNLGNAYLHGGELGRALANYERAQLLDPVNRQSQENLAFARGQVSVQASNQASQFDVDTMLQSVRHAVVVGYVPILWTLLTSSCVFWGLAIARTIGLRFSFWQIAAFPLLLLACSGSLMAVFQTSPTSANRGIVVADKLTLRAGDGESFHPVATIENAEGQPVEVLAKRGNWARVQTTQGKVGWILCQSLEIVTNAIN